MMHWVETLHIILVSTRKGNTERIAILSVLPLGGLKNNQSMLSLFFKPPKFELYTFSISQYFKHIFQ